MSEPRNHHEGSTEAAGTGERGSSLPAEHVRDSDDIGTDHIERLNDLNLDDADALSLNDEDVNELALDKSVEEDEEASKPANLN